MSCAFGTHARGFPSQGHCMRRLGFLLLAYVWLLALPVDATAKLCSAEPEQAGSGFFGALWGFAHFDCCDRSVTRREYLTCVKETLRPFRAVAPRECHAAVRDCARRSVCGRGPAVACCLNDEHGNATCKIVRDAVACEARGGVASAGWTCCNACRPSRLSACETSSAISDCTSCTTAGCKFCRDQGNYGCREWSTSCVNPEPSKDPLRPRYSCD